MEDKRKNKLPGALGVQSLRSRWPASWRRRCWRFLAIREGDRLAHLRPSRLRRDHGEATHRRVAEGLLAILAHSPGQA